MGIVLEDEGLMWKWVVSGGDWLWGKRWVGFAVVHLSISNWVDACYFILLFSDEFSSIKYLFLTKLLNIRISY